MDYRCRWSTLRLEESVFNGGKKSEEIETELLFGWNKKKVWRSLLGLYHLGWLLQGLLYCWHLLRFCPSFSTEYALLRRIRHNFDPC